VTRNDKARERARGWLREDYQLDGLPVVTIPDHGGVEYAADGRAYVEALIEVPAAMLREEKADE